MLDSNRVFGAALRSNYPAFTLRLLLQDENINHELTAALPQKWMQTIKKTPKDDLNEPRLYVFAIGNYIFDNVETTTLRKIFPQHRLIGSTFLAFTTDDPSRIELKIWEASK